MFVIPTYNIIAQIGNPVFKFRNVLPSSSFTMNHNFWAKITYGNRRSNGIQICHWNSRSGYFSNKKTEIENIDWGYKPHVLGISESSFKVNHNIEEVQLQDYNLYLSKTPDNPNLLVSRVAAYVHKDLIVKVRDDLI